MSGHPGYKLLLDEMWDLHCRKAKSYGSDEDSLANLRSGERFGVPAWKRCLVEAESAFYRTVNYCNGRNPSNENLENALMDAAAFSMLALLFVREERGKLNTENLMAKVGFYKWSNGRYRLYPESLAKGDETAVNAGDAQDPEAEYCIDTGLFQVKVNPEPTGYRPPSEEIGNKMTEVLEKAK